jgi:diguanylate cyclase (GGDEF)-like protein/PAS domain S-box-containing protein
VDKKGVVSVQSDTAQLDVHGQGAGPVAAQTARKNIRAEELLRLILTLSTNFIILPPDEIDDGIHDVLGAVGSFASVDRCYVFRFGENGKRVINTHEWHSQGMLFQGDGLKSLSEEELPWFFERIRGLGVLHVPDTTELPPKARAEKAKFLGENVKSLLVVPMVYGYSLVGFLGLDSFQEKKTWDEDIISLLKIVGEIFVNALVRKRAVEALRISEEKYRNIFENAIEGMFQMTPKGGFLSINPAMARMYGFDSPEEMIATVLDSGKQLYADAEEHAELIRILEDRGHVEGYESQRVRKDGVRFWASTNVHTVKDENGDILYYEGTVEDITSQKNMEEMLFKERETFKAILEKAPYGVALIDGNGHYLFVNPEFTIITGYTLEDIPTGRDWFSKAYPDPEYRREAIRIWKEDLPRIKGDDTILSVSCRDGSIKEIEFRLVLLDDGRIITTLSDMTQRKRAVEALKESEAKFRTLFEDSKDAIYIASRDGYFLDCNKSFLSLFGYTKEEALKIRIRDTYYRDEDRDQFKMAMKKNGFVRDHEVKLLQKSGAVMDCILSASDKKASDGAVIGYQGIVRDITAFKKAEETIRYMAYHDALTGLPNRILFSDRLTVAMAQARRGNERVAVVILDLDRFKSVNDTLGHKVGDLLLKAAANRLSATLRKSDTVARMGGDEFLLVLSDFVDVDDVEMVAGKIIQAFQKPFILDARRLPITTSIGVSIYPENGEDTDNLVKRADIAMYNAKRRGGNGYCLYSPDMENSPRSQT